MSIYAIGDIHGSIHALKTIFQFGLIKTNDKVIFLGDSFIPYNSTNSTFNSSYIPEQDIYQHQTSSLRFIKQINPNRP